MIRVNGEELHWGTGTISALLQERGLERDARGVAVAKNGEIVPRAEWPSVSVTAGDEIEIVQARQGG